MHTLAAVSLSGALVSPAVIPTANARDPERTATVVSGVPPGEMADIC